MEKCLSAFKALGEASVDDKASVIAESSVLLLKGAWWTSQSTGTTRASWHEDSTEELPHHTALWACLWDISFTVIDGKG